MTARTILALIGFAVLTDASAQESVPRFEPTECPFETEAPLKGVDCGELVVWENRERHEEGTLRLAVAILRSTAEEPKPDPLVFITGGPGSASVVHTPSRAESDFWNRFREKRDIIFFDQRGTGYSDPEFCNEMDRVFTTTRYLGLSPDEATARRVETARNCREEMLAKGIDFSRYNSETSARDLGDLRRALGYERWNLFGISYGTRVALTAMRETPSGIRSVILDSTSPPNARIWVDAPRMFAQALDRVFEQCAQDPACRRAYPDLEAEFRGWLDSLDRDPLEIAMEDTTRFPDGRLVVDGALAGNGLFAGLYKRQFIPLIPLVIREADRESRHVWKAMADQLVNSPDKRSIGLQLAVNCYEVAPFNPPAEIKRAWAEYPRLSDAMAYRNKNAECAVWHDEHADPSYSEPVRSDLPTLILGGEFDPTTPPAYGRLAAETLSNSTFIEIPAHGHGVAPRTDCTRGLASRFLEDPRRSLDTSCVTELPSVSFIADVHTSRGVYPVARGIQQGPGMPVLAGAGFVGILFLSGIVGWPLGALVSRVRGRRRSGVSTLERGSRWAAALAALLSLVFAAGLLLAIWNAASVNPLMLVFGVPGEFGWLFLLPWIVLALTVVVAFAVVESWRAHWWRLGHRIHYSLVAAGCVVFLAFAAWQGLL